MENKKYYNRRINECEFKNNICWLDFSSTSIHFEGKLYLLCTCISFPSFPHKILNPNSYYPLTYLFVNSTFTEANKR